MTHSNNAARIRLWLNMKQSMQKEIDTIKITYADLQSKEYASINPLKKVPAFIRSDGSTIFESNVILSYLEDKYGGGQTFTPSTPEGRQDMNLLCRIHDLYIASPNCTSPGFSHSQGAMYLSKEWHGETRTMTVEDRAAKLSEIWKQLSWLEMEVKKNCNVSKQGQYHLLGDQLTLADFTWFPTCTFMEYMLPRIFGWPELFNVCSKHPNPTPFPHLAAWYTNMQLLYPEFTKVRNDIYNHWINGDKKGIFQPIITQMSNATRTDPTLKFQYGVPIKANLNYQEPPSKGKSTGRYINQPDRGDVVDVHVKHSVMIKDAREIVPPAELDTYGFTLKTWPTEVTNFQNNDEVTDIYFKEMEHLIKNISGADSVYIFDHTIRMSGQTSLNANALEGEAAAAPVPRVHCDYTAEGAESCECAIDDKLRLLLTNEEVLVTIC